MSSLLISSSLFIGSTLLILLKKRIKSFKYNQRILLSSLPSININNNNNNYSNNNNNNNNNNTQNTSIKLSLTDYWEAKDYENSYLEEILGDKALNWARNKNNECLKYFNNIESSDTYNKTLSILQNKEKIPHVEKIGNKFYNFWKDDQHIKGVWRRTTFESYTSNNTDWEIVLDLDKLCEIENQSWVYSGHLLYDLEQNILPTRTLIHLSVGGSDANVIREFDLIKCQFVDPILENGFYLPEAKTTVCWKSFNTLIVGTNFNDNNSLTSSGYPRVVHEWNRGTSLIESSTRIFEGELTDVNVSQSIHPFKDFQYECRVRSLTYYTSLYFIKSYKSDKWYELNNLPSDVTLQFFSNQILITNRSDWFIPNTSITYLAGSLIAINIDDFLINGLDSKMNLLFTPTSIRSLDSLICLKSYVILNTLENIKSRLVYWEYLSELNEWIFKGEEDNSSINGFKVFPYDSNENNMFWLTTSSFLLPFRLFLLNAEDKLTNLNLMLSNNRILPIKSNPSFFNTDNLIEEQYEVISFDGTKVPYFILRSKNMKYNSKNKTVLYGYGGFEYSLCPSYNPIIGTTWLNNEDNVYVIGNIRGGGEFGPKWHQAALRENRIVAYNDFIAIAEDLIKRQITSPEYLAIRGGSNGGLLVSNVMLLRPDLFQSVVCQVPLIDMKRYSHLLAGASWMAEYGNPDISEDWNFLKNYSSYHNIDYINGSKKYPNLFVITSTKDDRVHPYHARSFIARLDQIGFKKSWYYENIEGGHNIAADIIQQAFFVSLYTEFLLRTLGNKKND